MPTEICNFNLHSMLREKPLVLKLCIETLVLCSTVSDPQPCAIAKSPTFLEKLLGCHHQETCVPKTLGLLTENLITQSAARGRFAAPAQKLD